MTRPHPPLPLLLIAGLCWAPAAGAKPRAFDVGYGGRNTVRFVSSALLETVAGRTAHLKGKLKVDPARVTRGCSGRLEVDMARFDTGIARRDKDLTGPQYLHTEKFPVAAFSCERVEARKRDLTGGDEVRVTLHGTLEFHGESKPVAFKGRARYVPLTKELEPLKKLGVKGDALHFRGELTLKLADWGIVVPQFLAPKIAGEVRVEVDVFAFAKPL